MLRILCLEDDEEDFEIINLMLRRDGMHVESKMVDNRDRFINELSSFNPDVILSDHALPQFNSIDALKISRASKKLIPFILVTGAVSDEFAVNCLKQGADDYILKSNLNRLSSAIKNAILLKEAERAKQDAVESLASQNEQLLKINQELDSLVYSVSHNLRAPLMSVLGLVSLAKIEVNSDAVHHYHDLMEKSIHSLDGTLNDILDYARNSRLDLQISKIVFEEIINDTLSKLEFMSGFENIAIKKSIKNTQDFYSDRYRLSVILNNIFSNAIKYSDADKKDSFFSISIELDSKNAKMVFEDNGIGIDSNSISKIFDMFFRATTTKTGSGLGLYIVKEAVDKLKGRIEIDSSIGRGTIFTIEIPNLKLFC